MTILQRTVDPRIEVGKHYYTLDPFTLDNLSIIEVTAKVLHDITREENISIQSYSCTWLSRLWFRLTKVPWFKDRRYININRKVYVNVLGLNKPMLIIL